MKKKALIISSYPAPYRVAVFKEMSIKYDVDVFFASNKNENRNADWFCKSDDFKFEVLNNKESKKLFSNALKNIRQYDFVVPYDPVQTPSIKAIILCRYRRIPYFINCDGAIIKPNFLRDLIKRFLFSGSTACFSSGKSATNYFLHYGVKDNRIFEHKFTSVDENDILLKPLDSIQKSEEKKKLGLDDIPTVVAIGQFIYRKGFDILLEAWKSFNAEYQLVIIGGGEEKSKYNEIIEKYGLENVYLKDFMNKNMIIKYYDASEIFVLPTREDVWGLVINEAMARGVPVITTDKCMAGVELIENGANGYVVRAENSEDIAQKIEEILKNYALREKIAINNINKSKEYTMSAMAKRQIDVIENALKRREQL